MHGILDSLPVQTHLQRVDAGGHVLGQQVAWLSSQPLDEGGHLLLTQTWRRQKKKRVEGWKDNEHKREIRSLMHAGRRLTKSNRRNFLLSHFP